MSVTQMPSGHSVNALTSEGSYAVALPTNAPSGVNHAIVTVRSTPVSGTNRVVQQLFDAETGDQYSRIMRGDTPTPWSGGGGREILTTNRDYYIRDDGSDTNDGLADAPDRAWATYDNVYTALSSGIDTNGYDVIVHYAPGDYTNQYIEYYDHLVGNGSLIVQGDPISPAGCVLGTGCYIQFSNVLRASIQGFTVDTGGPGAFSLSRGNYVSYAMILVDAGIDLDEQSTALVYSTSLSFPSGGAYAFRTRKASHLTLSNITLTGTPAWSTAGLIASDLSSVRLNNAITGGATGQRHLISGNSVFANLGASATAFPGSVAGVAETGGQIVNL